MNDIPVEAHYGGPLFLVVLGVLLVIAALILIDEVVRDRLRVPPAFRRDALRHRVPRGDVWEVPTREPEPTPEQLARLRSWRARLEGQQRGRAS